jgi:acetyl-CoA acetyltransferase
VPHNVYVIGVATHPPAEAELDLRLEEIAFRTARAALADAGIGRAQLDHLTIGACDELDGRPISSMLMAAPAGGFLTDEIKVSDSGAMALCLGVARIQSGCFQVGAVASWCKPSKTDVDTVMRLRSDPFFSRPIGLDGLAAEGLFAQAVAQEFGIDEAEINARTSAAFGRAASNPRALQRGVACEAAIAASEYVAAPVRKLHFAPHSDGAASLILASETFVRANTSVKPLARIAGVGWATDAYHPSAFERCSMTAFSRAWDQALTRADKTSASDFDVLELECQTGWHEAAYVRALDIVDEKKVTPSGGAFAQNPLACTGLVGAAEAVLQVSGRAGPIQRAGARWAAAHSSHGFAGQGHVVACFEAAGERS